MGFLLAIVSYFVAKEKGRNAPLFVVLGLIPIVNMFSAFFLLAAADLTLHAKLDRLLAEIERQKAA
jgi:threonine/homoserine/homoserine lactone efflux protein